MNQKYLKCVTHPERDITMIYMEKDCKYESRLACNKCLEEYKTLDGFKDYFDILNNINYTLESNQGPYNGIEVYLNVINIDICQQIQKLKESFDGSIKVLTKYFEKGLDQLKQFQISLKATHQTFSQLVGHSNFQAKTQALLDIDEQHYSNQWVEMEESLNNFIQNFHEGHNIEINKIIDQIKKETCQLSYQSDFYLTFQSYPKLLDQLKRSIIKAINQLDMELIKIQQIQIPISPLLNDLQFPKQLLKQTNINCPKYQLIYKGTRDGMSSQQFWAKCNNKTNLMIICKGYYQHIFGGYSPCTWVTDSTWKQDDTLSSFLFSATKKQIYTLNKGNTILGYQNQSYGPYFIDFQVPKNFQNCTSQLKNFTAEGVVVADTSSHLMGFPFETLIEMEVYQIG